MSAVDELKTVVDAARKTEVDGRKFYGDTAAKSRNPLAKRMFQSLADAEGQHLEFIDQLVRGQFKAPAYDRDFARRLATVFSAMPESTRSQAAGTPDDIAALELGIELEDRSMAFYRKWAETAKSEPVRKFCARLRVEEEEHWRILQSTKDYLGDTGNWFMAQERWSFDGG